MTEIVLCFMAYFIGSFPTAFLLGKIYKIDIRKHGSGNVGATNALRTLGRTSGVITILVDFTKGWIPVTFVVENEYSLIFGLFILLFAIIGHMYSPWLSFQGGKGMATIAGGIFALQPNLFMLSGIFFCIIIGMFGYVSLASILTSMFATISFGFSHGFSSIAFFILSFMSIAIILKHHQNLHRIYQGKEPKLHCLLKYWAQNKRKTL